MSKPSLLPPNSTRLERDLETVTARVGELPVPIGDLWNSQRCPAHLLPWLAWSLSIENWGADWPEHIQRQVIADSVEVHRLKGTVGAVRRAIEALGARIDLVEWWQNGGEPHTAELIAYAQDNLNPQGNTLLTAELQQQLWKAVEASKPARSHIAFRVGVAMENTAGIAAAAHTTAYGRQTHDCQVPAENISSRSSLSAATDSLVVERRTLTANAPSQHTGTAHIAMASAVSLVIQRNSMGAS